MMGITAEHILNHRYQEILAPEHLAIVNDMLTALKESESGVVERQLTVPVRAAT